MPSLLGLLVGLGRVDVLEPFGGSLRVARAGALHRVDQFVHVRVRGRVGDRVVQRLRRRGRHVAALDRIGELRRLIECFAEPDATGCIAIGRLGLPGQPVGHVSRAGALPHPRVVGSPYQPSVEHPHAVEVTLQCERPVGELVDGERERIDHRHGICCQVEEVEFVSHVNDNNERTFFMSSSLSGILSRPSDELQQILPEPCDAVAGGSSRPSLARRRSVLRQCSTGDASVGQFEEFGDLVPIDRIHVLQTHRQPATVTVMRRCVEPLVLA